MPTILVAEDENPLRNLLCRVLTNEGFEVLCAPDGETALEMAAGHARVDLLVSDVRMPGINGLQLYEELKTRRPDLEVLFISGYAEGRELNLPFLAKPFTPTAFIRKVREVLKPSGSANHTARR